MAGVLDQEQAEYLADAYSKRSRTVHQSRLHGTEAQLGGWAQMSVFVADPVIRFDIGTVVAAHAASRTLILHELGITPDVQ
jgi:hypothetical protein